MWLTARETTHVLIKMILSPGVMGVNKSSYRVTSNGVTRKLLTRNNQRAKKKNNTKPKIRTE